MPDQPFNILWITTDEMKASAMSVYGNAFTRLPAAERMAREGTTFTNSFVQMPKCVPSRYSMITGRYPHTDGRRTLTGRTDHITPHPAVKDNSMFGLHEDDPNLVSLLRAGGYRTCLLGKNHLVEWNLHTKWFDQTPSWKWAKKIYEDSPHEGDRLWRADYRGRLAANLDPDTLDDGVTATEYAVMLALVVVAVVMAIRAVGDTSSGIWANDVNKIQNAVRGQ